MVFASAYKVYVGFSSRRFTTDLHDAYAGGVIRSTPHFNSVSRHLSDPELTEILKNLITVSSLPLKAVETDSPSILLASQRAASFGGSTRSTGVRRITASGSSVISCAA